MTESKGLDELEKRIRSAIEEGALAKAVETLDSLNFKTTTRGDLLKAAHYYRRCGRADRAISILRPYVRPSHKNLYKTRDAEKIEYAASLTGLGAVQESQKLLSTIGVSSNSDLQLFQAFNMIKQWNYSAAIPFLESFLEQESSSYRLSVGRVNLLQSYIFCDRMKEAKIIIEDLEWQRALASEGKFRLLGNLEELKAQYYFECREWDLAKKCLDQAKGYLKEDGGIEFFFIQKWNFIVSLYENRHQSSGDDYKQNWKKMRAKAWELKHFETVREFDYHYAICSQNESLLQYVYWGTPFRSYKEKILSDFRKLHKSDFDVGADFERLIGAGESSEFLQVPDDAVRLIETGVQLKGSASASVSPLIQTLFSSLNSDFYIGQTLYSIFEHVYPDEFFNLESSPEKIRQIVFRLRDHLGMVGCALSVNHEQGRYSLVSGAASTVVVCGQKNFAVEPIVLASIRRHFGGDEFRIEELASKLDISSRSVSNKIKEAVDLGYLQKIGAGPKTRYRLIG